MAASNINRVILTGNLTFDPELRSLPVRHVGVQAPRRGQHPPKNNATGEWEDKPNYFDVTVWGAQGENCARYLAKGRPVAIDGRLEWSEWADKDTGKNRSKVEIVADTVQFLNGRERRRRRGGGGGFTPRADVPVDTSDFGAPPPAQPQPVSAPVGTPADDDIPF